MAVITIIHTSIQTNIMKDTEVICLKARDAEKTVDVCGMKATEILAESSEIQKIIAAGREREEKTADFAEAVVDTHWILAATFGSG